MTAAVPGAWPPCCRLRSFLDGALVWFAPRSFDTVPVWATTAAFALVVLIAIWTVVDLGFGPTAVQSTRIVP